MKKQKPKKAPARQFVESLFNVTISIEPGTDFSENDRGYVYEDLAETLIAMEKVFGIDPVLFRGLRLQIALINDDQASYQTNGHHRNGCISLYIRDCCDRLKNTAVFAHELLHALDWLVGKKLVEKYLPKKPFFYCSVQGYRRLWLRGAKLNVQEESLFQSINSFYSKHYELVKILGERSVTVDNDVEIIAFEGEHIFEAEHLDCRSPVDGKEGHHTLYKKVIHNMVGVLKLEARAS